MPISECVLHRNTTSRETSWVQACFLVFTVATFTGKEPHLSISDHTWSWMTWFVVK